MKIKQLITELEKNLNNKGNIEVRIPQSGEIGMEEVTWLADISRIGIRYTDDKKKKVLCLY